MPIASLATTPDLRILPGCTIASKGRVRSLLLVRRANRPLSQLRNVAADTASRTTVAYARILFHKWGNADVPFIPMAADLDAMLARADAAIVIGDPALMALEERANRFERADEELVYHDLTEEWRSLTGLPFVSAVWGTTASAEHEPLDESISKDFIRSRDHGLAHIDALVDEWAQKLPLPASTIHEYLTDNIHYVLDDECLEGMRGGSSAWPRETGVLPRYMNCLSQLTPSSHHLLWGQSDLLVCCVDSHLDSQGVRDQKFEGAPIVRENLLTVGWLPAICRCQSSAWLLFLNCLPRIPRCDIIGSSFWFCRRLCSASPCMARAHSRQALPVPICESTWASQWLP